MSHVTLETTLGEGENAKVVELNHLIIDSLLPYNIILSWPAIDALGAVIFTQYLVLKYLLHCGRVGTDRWECYFRPRVFPEFPDDGKGSAHTAPEAPDTNIDYWDPRLGVDNERLMPTKDLKEVRICPSTHQVTKIGTSLTVEEERD